MKNYLKSCLEIIKTKHTPNSDLKGFVLEENFYKTNFLLFEKNIDDRISS